MEKLWKQIENDLGWTDRNMLRSRPYNGQSHTDTGVRGQTKISEITFRDLRDCFIRACFLCSGDQNSAKYEEANKGEEAKLCEKDVYELDFNKIDIIALSQNMSCEIEKLMGIYPNISKLESTNISMYEFPEE